MGCNSTDDALYDDMQREAAKRGLAWQYAQYVVKTQHLWPTWETLEKMKWKEGRQTPDTALMRFVYHRFLSPAVCLDIGSGEGANARELRQRGHNVITVDTDSRVMADVTGDVRELSGGMFDCIFDVNTLCHVEDPPFEKISSWLKPDGYFFSICPTNFAPRYIQDSKDFTRTASELELREMLQPFFKEVKINWRSEPDLRVPRSSQLESWIVTAQL